MDLNIRGYNQGVLARPVNNKSPVAMHPRVRRNDSHRIWRPVLYPAGIDHTGEMVYILPTAAW
jgi:hypothetical protein